MTTYATDEQILSLSRFATDDTVCEIMRNGCMLSWQQADELGEQVIDWMRSRLELRIETDADGVRCYPSDENAR